MCLMALDSKWTNTVNDGQTNAAWDAYDAVVQGEVNAYNTRFAHEQGYIPVDWKLCKAILWVESGGPKSPAWKARAMQIGNPGDPAYNILQFGKENSGLILSAALATDLKGKSIDDPALNIRAGIAYLFVRLAKFEEKSVTDPTDRQDHEYIVLPHDSLWVIAKKVGTTMDLLKAMNPGVDRMIHPKQILKYRKASMKMLLVGWRGFNPATIAQYYNGGGDADYAAKINYVLDLFRKLKR
jgi:hypothetical protein